MSKYFNFEDDFLREMMSRIKPYDIQIEIDGSSIIVDKKEDEEKKKREKAARSLLTVDWNDIIGQEKAKEQLKEAAILPYTKADIYNFYKKKPPKGILLYGPPGCGKTMLGKALAKAMLKMHDGMGEDTCFKYFKATQFLNNLVGVGEREVRNMFKQARDHFVEYGYPSILFIDEADAILTSRATDNHHLMGYHPGRDILPAFLAEMDGMELNGAILIIATNQPEIIDPAMLRDGRIDRKIKVPRPNYADSKVMFLHYLKHIPICKKENKENLSEVAVRSLFSPERVLYQISTTSSDKEDLILGDLVNGAMIAGIVDKATSIAMQKDLKNDTQTGISSNDILTAVDDVETQNRDLEHSGDIRNFVEDLGGRLTGILKISEKGIPLEIYGNSKTSHFSN